jgi:uncharacterized membrane protein
VDPYANEWLDLLARWLHVIAGIAWIGTSFYFIALDNHLRPPKGESDDEGRVGGEAWEIHGGGFYRVQKYRRAPRVLPEPLYWFKWEAYTTWLSGFALMIVLYYVNADTYLIDKSVADLSPAAAIAISIGLLVAAWIVYDALSRLVGNEILLAALLLGLVTITAWGVSHLFSGRAEYIQVGAMLGTMMAGNVFLVIIPAHWQIIRARAGSEPEAAPGIRAHQRSVHNNYLTLPVVFTMISNHFPVLYGREHEWLVLVVLMAIGAWARHFFNLRHEGRTVWAIPVTAALALAGLALAIKPDETKTASGKPPVSSAYIRALVQRRCAPCHSDHPTKVSTAPKGIVLDTPEQISRQADAIEEQAVISRAMPLGNVTGMTQQERDLLGRWISQGARFR